MTIKEHIEYIKNLSMNNVDDYINTLKIQCEEMDENFENELKKKCIDAAPGSLYSDIMDLSDGQKHDDDDGNKDDEKDELSKEYFDMVDKIDEYIYNKYGIEV